MGFKPNRRQFVKTAAAGTAVAVALPYISRAQENVLNVFTYAGGYESTLRDHLVPAFEESTGAKVVLHAGWWDMLPKLKASPPGEPAYDLVMTDPTQGKPAIDEGLFQKLDLSKIENIKYMPDRLREDWYQANEWGVNLAGSLMVMAFNSEADVKAPAHWHELLDPKYSGKLSMYNAFYQSLYAFAQMKAGAEGEPGGGYQALKNDLDGVLEFAKSNRDMVRVWWTATGDFMDKLLQKEIAGGVSHSTGPFAAEAEGKPIDIVVPEEGTAIVQVFWSIPEDTGVSELGHEFVDQFLSTDFQVKWGTVPRLALQNMEAAKIAAEQDELYRKYLPKSVEDWNAISFYPYDVYFDNWDKINDFWDREVLRTSS